MQEKKLKNEKYFTSLQNSQLFIYLIVCFGFFSHGIVCLNSVRKQIFMATEKRGDSCQEICLVSDYADEKAPLASLAICSSSLHKAP